MDKTVVVPEVTSDMVNAGADAMLEGMSMLNRGRSYQSVCKKIFEAMIAAAPAPETQDERALNALDLLKRTAMGIRTDADVNDNVAVIRAALTAPQDAQERESQGEREFNNARLRRVVRLLDLDSAVPEGDLLGCMGAVLGMVARKIEEQQDEECKCMRCGHTWVTARALTTAQPADKPEGNADQSKCSDGGLCGAGGYCGECKAEQHPDAEDPPEGDNKIWNALAWMYRRMKPGYGRLPFVEEAMVLSKNGKAEKQDNGKMPPPEDWGNVSKEELARRELEYLKKIAKADQQAEPVATRWAIYFDNLGDSEMRNGFVTNWKLYESEEAAKYEIAQTCRLEQQHYYSARQVYIYTAPAQPQLSDEEILTLAKSFDGDLMPDCAPVLCGNEIVSFAHALLSRQSGDMKGGA